MTSRLAIPVMFSAAIALSACATTTPVASEFGGVERPMTPPALAQACELSEWRRKVDIMPTYPASLAFFDADRVSGEPGDPNSITMTFDIASSGQTRNIRHAGPDWQRRYEETRSAVGYMADVVAAWEFERVSGGPVPYARDCVFEFSFQQQ